MSGEVIDMCSERVFASSALWAFGSALATVIVVAVGHEWFTLRKRIERRYKRVVLQCSDDYVRLGMHPEHAYERAVVELQREAEEVLPVLSDSPHLSPDI